MALASLLCVAGCGLWWVRDEPLDGPYRLVAVDVSEDMMLCRFYEADGMCESTDLPEPTVFQAGWNAKYIVVARHPRKWPERTNRAITEYYYVVRQPNEASPTTRVKATGPFDESEYQREKERLLLPDFSKVFNDLK